MRHGGAATNKVKAMKTVLLFRKIDSLIFAAAFSLAATYSVKSDSCGGSGSAVPDVVVVENEPFARIRLYRSSAIDLVQTVYYFTSGGNPGVDYVPSSGTATFAVGEEATNVDIPLIDNGLLDGIRDFGLVLTNRSPGLLAGPDFPWVRIVDNEMGSAVDPLFVPDRGASQFYGYKYVAAPMPDGRILLPDSRELTMLHSDGRVDLGFATKLTNQFASLRDVQVLGDGRILVAGHDYQGHPAPRLVRLLPSGALDTIFTIPNFTGTAIGQPDGKILAISTNANNKTTLGRFNTDGSPDGGFVQSAFVDAADPLALQSDGKILVGKSDHRPGSVLVRLNPDGSPDNGFASALRDGNVDSLLLRANRKLIIIGNFSVGGDSRLGHLAIAQLNEDGGLDTTFKLDPALYFGLSTPLLEKADGGLVAAGMDINGYGAVMRWNADGSLARNLALIKGLPGGCSYSGLTLALTQDGQILVGGNISNVDGSPRRGLARLLARPPERDFRVFTPAEFVRSGVARIRVARTGPTTNAASVSFITRDATARAGMDYAARTGTLEFAPLEVSKEVVVPLLAKSGADARLFFNLELRNPSAGYTNIASTPIGIVPDLRIATDSLRPRADGSVAITLRGTLPRRYYILESSADLKNWYVVAGAQALGAETVFHPVWAFDPTTGGSTPPPWRGPSFFRARDN